MSSPLSNRSFPSLQHSNPCLTIESRLLELASRGTLPSCCPVSPDSSSSANNFTIERSETGQTILTSCSIEESGGGGSSIVSVGSDSSRVSSQAPSLPAISANHNFLPLTSTNSLINLSTSQLRGEVTNFTSTSNSSEPLLPRANSTTNSSFHHSGLTPANTVLPLGLPLHLSGTAGSANSAFHVVGESEPKKSIQHPFGFGGTGCKRPLSSNISLPSSLSASAAHHIGMELKSPMGESPLFQLPDVQEFNARIQQAAALTTAQQNNQQHQHNTQVAAARLGMMGCTPTNLFNMMQAVAANNFLLRQQQQAAACKESSSSLLGTISMQNASGLPPPPSLMSKFLQQLQAIGQQSSVQSHSNTQQFMPQSNSATTNSFGTAAASPASSVVESLSSNSNGHPSIANHARLCREFLTATASVPTSNIIGGGRPLATNNGSTTASVASNASVNGDLCGVELCVVCGDKASGRHYGAISCEGCKGFFKRSIRKQTLKNQLLQIAYVCRGAKDCPVTKFHRNRCQFCRLRKCLSMGMKSESVQAERRPINAALAAAAAAVAAASNTSPTSPSDHSNSKYSKMNNGMAISRNGSDGLTESNSTTLCRSTSVASSVTSNHHRFQRIDQPDLSSNHYLQQGLLAIVQQQQQQHHQNNYPTTSSSVSDFILQLNQNSPVNSSNTAINSIATTSGNKVKLERKYSSDATSTTTTTLDMSNAVPPTSNSVSPTTPLSPTARANQFNCKIETSSNCHHDQFDPECSCNLAATTSSAAPSPISSGPGDGIGRGLSQQFSEDEPTSPTSSSSSHGSAFPMFSPECAKFELPIPHPQPQELNIQFICETASRLLFLSVHWIKNVRNLAAKPFYMECTMKLKWCDLFVLGLMQCADEFNLPNMLQAMNNHLMNCAKFGQLKPEKYEEVNKQISYLLALVHKIRHFKLTSLEFAYLKTIAFTANDLPEPLVALANSSIKKSHCPRTQLQLQQQQYGRQLNGQACQELYEHILSVCIRENEATDLLPGKEDKIKNQDQHIETNGLHNNNYKKETPDQTEHHVQLMKKDCELEEDKHSGSPSSSHSSSSMQSDNVKAIDKLVNQDSNKKEQNSSSSSQSLHAPTPILLAALDRHSQLLQLLPCLRWFKQSVLVELFFSGLIGSLSIETVMPFILSMDVMQIFDKTSPNSENGIDGTSSCGIMGSTEKTLQQQSFLALTNAAGTSIKNF